MPTVALLCTTLVSALAFLSSTFGDQKVYQVFYNASSLSGFLVWFGIAICHVRFRRAWVAQGRSLSELRFQARFHPIGTWWALLMFAVVILFANFGVFQETPFSWFDFITGYAMIPAYAALYLLHKRRYRTRLVPLRECQLDAG